MHQNMAHFFYYTPRGIRMRILELFCELINSFPDDLNIICSRMKMQRTFQQLLFVLSIYIFLNFLNCVKYM